MEIFNIPEIEAKIGYVFKDKMLLRKAFTHASYAHEHNQQDNELLEFFGDSIMEFIVTEYLCKHAKGDEGKLTEKRAQMVSKTPLIEAVDRLGIQEYILLGNGQKKTAREDDKLFSSVYEALVAAIYQDGGLVPTKRFIKNTIIKNFLDKQKGEGKEPIKAVVKSQLQEHVQKHKLGNIVYKQEYKKGPDHLAEFGVALYIDGKLIAKGKGSSKKNAEAQAAYEALKILTPKKDGKKH